MKSAALFALCLMACQGSKAPTPKDPPPKPQPKASVTPTVDAAKVAAKAAEPALLTTLEEDFTRLDAKVWAPIAVAPGKAAISREGRLLLALETMKAPPKPLAVTGVRSRTPMKAGPLTVEWTLDWNGQENGSYLNAALYLSPYDTNGDPSLLPRFIRVEHIGVPPGKNWRHAVGEKLEGHMKFLDNAGWPGKRDGRLPTKARLKVELRASGSMVLREGGLVRSSVITQHHKWPQTYVYLVLIGHSNYPLREVFVDDLKVRVKGAQ